MYKNKTKKRQKQDENKGVFQPDIPLEKLEKKQVVIPTSYPERKSVRYRCARIANKNWEEKDGLKEKIEEQFDEDMNWDNFMVVWDISENDPYEVVRK